MLEKSQNDRGRGRVWLLGAAVGAVLLATSFLVHPAVADHRVTEQEVAAMAARIEQRAGFPVLVDAEVVSRLNGWVADAGARSAMREALGRMSHYRPMIDSTLRSRGLPAELLSVALAESRFDNTAHPNTPVERRSVGIWQIIPSTARKLGLEVSASRDQRLDPANATEAAATLLSNLYAHYGDWPVAIAAYNAGERHIDSLLDGASSKTDARTRVLAGNAEHTRYLRAVMAALILIENPTLLD
ncbi:MAG TPA: transglycosylase SLT domain-containing protein [Polyangiales bacterium]|nr:transglycosylase SLT domain-containing protein [Polyangiales bacterium]